MIDTNAKLLDACLALLEQLSYNNKLDVIARLTLSMKEENSKPNNSFMSLYGALENEQSAEELIHLIKSSRVFNRKTESFD